MNVPRFPCFINRNSAAKEERRNIIMTIRFIVMISRIRSNHVRETFGQHMYKWKPHCAHVSIKELKENKWEMKVYCQGPIPSRLPLCPCGSSPEDSIFVVYPQQLFLLEWPSPYSESTFWLVLKVHQTENHHVLALLVRMCCTYSGHSYEASAVPQTQHHPPLTANQGNK